MLQFHSRRAVTAVRSACDSFGWRQGGSLVVVGWKLGQVGSAGAAIGLLLGA